MVTFTGRCLVHRAEIMQLHGAWPEALDEARRAGERFAQQGSEIGGRRGRLPTGGDPPPAGASSPRPRRPTGRRAGAGGSRSRAWRCCAWRRANGGRRGRRDPPGRWTRPRERRTRARPAARLRRDHARGRRCPRRPARACRELEEIADGHGSGHAGRDGRAGPGSGRPGRGRRPGGAGRAAAGAAGVAGARGALRGRAGAGAGRRWPAARWATRRRPALELEAAREAFERAGSGAGPRPGRRAASSVPPARATG